MAFSERVWAGFITTSPSITQWPNFLIKQTGDVSLFLKSGVSATVEYSSDIGVECKNIPLYWDPSRWHDLSANNTCLSGCWFRLWQPPALPTNTHASSRRELWRNMNQGEEARHISVRLARVKWTIIWFEICALSANSKHTPCVSKPIRKITFSGSICPLLLTPVTPINVH